MISSFLFLSCLPRNHYSHVDLEVQIHGPGGWSLTNRCLQYWFKALAWVTHRYLQIDLRTGKGLSNIFVLSDLHWVYIDIHAFERCIRNNSHQNIRCVSPVSGTFFIIQSLYHTKSNTFDDIHSISALVPPTSCRQANFRMFTEGLFLSHICFIVLAAAKTFNSDFCRQVTNALY